jgi:Tol biopolymer transport system component
MKAISVLRFLKATQRIARWSAAMTGLAVTGLAQATAATTGGYKVEETLLGPFYWVEGLAGTAPGLISVSADGRHVAFINHGGDYCQSVGSRICIFVDGHANPVAEGSTVHSLALSADGKRLAYAVSQGKKSWVVVDGQTSPVYDRIPFPSSAPDDLTFSPDGKRFAYLAAKSDGKHTSIWVVVDGREFTGYNGVMNITFSPDSKRVAYVAEVDKGLSRISPKDWRFTAVVDGIPGPDYNQVLGPAFSPDSKRVVYGALQHGKWSMVVDGQAGVAYDDLPTDAVIGEQPFGSRDLIPAHWSKMDGQPDGTYDELGSLNPGLLRFGYAALVVFSADSKHLAYVARNGGKWMVVEDSKEGPGTLKIGIGSPAISPDGKRLAYSVKTSSVRPWKVMVDDQEGAEGFDKMFNPSFSPDGKRVAFAAEKVEFGRMKNWVFVVDGQAGVGNAAIGNWTFSLDSKHVAYAAQTRQGFSTDYPWGGGGWSVFLDGKAGAEYSVVVPGTLRFGPDGALEFLAVQNEGHSMGQHHGSLYRVRYTPTP